MDTRFWGPSGWKLLHHVATEFDPARSSVYAEFFETIPYILPCKFCRASLTDYYRAHPFDPSSDVEKWMYTLHNCVNDKLRAQGLHPAKNPPYSRVKALYAKLRSCEWQQQLQGFWDFLFSVGYHHPKEKRLYASPMPDCPSTVHRCKEDGEKNKWNVLPMKERIQWFDRFWSLLPAVLPSEISTSWNRALAFHPPSLSTRHSTLSWLWKMRCTLDKGFQDPYASVCKLISHHSSDCATQRGIFTCRKRSTGKRRTDKRRTTHRTPRKKHSRGNKTSKKQ